MMGGWWLSPADCSDVAVTAAEGGIGYWSQIDTYAPSRWGLPESPAAWRDDLPDDFVYYSLRETNSFGDPIGELKPLTVAGIRAGYASACAASLGRDVLGIVAGDLDGLDANSADVVVQHAIFGKVIYG